MGPETAKQIVFRYDGDASSEDGFFDNDGEFTVPKEGEIIQRHGQQWRVAAIQSTISDALPVVRVFLIESSHKHVGR